MLFAVRFHDIADGLPIRNAHMDAHMAWLGANDDAIVAAGPLRVGDPDSTPVGALWLVRAKDFASAEALLAGDPFMKNGLRAKTEIYHWAKGYPSYTVEI